MKLFGTQSTLQDDVAVMIKPPNSPRQGGRLKDLLLTIVAVFMGLLIWFWVTEFESHVTERIFTRVDVHIEGLSELRSRGFNIIGDETFNVDVTLEGRNVDLNRLNSSSIRAYVDVRGQHAGTHTLPVRIMEMNGLQVINQTTDNIRLNIDRNITKSVPVRAEIIRRSIEVGIEMGDLIFTPPTVSVEGPEQLLNEIAYAKIYLDLGDELVMSSREVISPFVLVDSNEDAVTQSPLIRESPNSIGVLIPIYTTREVPLTVKYRYGYYDDTHVSVTITPSTIMLRGEPHYLNNLNEIVLGTINERSYDTDTTIIFRLPIDRLEGDIRNLSGVTSAEVAITFRDMVARTLRVPASRFNVTSPPEHLEYNIREEYLSTRLFGPSDRINIPARAVEITVDLSGFTEPGIYSVPVEAIVTAEGSRVFVLGEYSVSVEISEIQ